MPRDEDASIVAARELIERQRQQRRIGSGLTTPLSPPRGGGRDGVSSLPRSWGSNRALLRQIAGSNRDDIEAALSGDPRFQPAAAAAGARGNPSAQDQHDHRRPLSLRPRMLEASAPLRPSLDRQSDALEAAEAARRGSASPPRLPATSPQALPPAPAAAMPAAATAFPAAAPPAGKEGLSLKAAAAKLAGLDAGAGPSPRRRSKAVESPLPLRRNSFGSRRESFGNTAPSARPLFQNNDGSIDVAGVEPLPPPPPPPPPPPRAPPTPPRTRGAVSSAGVAEYLPAAPVGAAGRVENRPRSRSPQQGGVGFAGSPARTRSPPPLPPAQSPAARAPASSPGDQWNAESPSRGGEDMYGNSSGNVGGNGEESDDGGGGSYYGGSDDEGSDGDGCEIEREMLHDLQRQRERRIADEDCEFALVLRPDDEYRDAVELLELAFAGPADLVSGSLPAGTRESTRAGAARLRESMGGAGTWPLRPGAPGAGGPRLPLSPSSPPPGGRRGGAAAGRVRLSLLEEMQEEDEGLQGGHMSQRRRDELRRRRRRRLARFVHLLSQGIIVRRHRPHKKSEQIVLQSGDSGHNVSWRPLLGEAGDNTGNNGGLLGHLMHRNRVRRHDSGEVAAASVVGVLPAVDPDPEHPGHFGTRSLRLSEDIPNPARTFSLLYVEAAGGGGGHTGVFSSSSGGGGQLLALDLECNADVEYALLFQGFVLLHMREMEKSGGGGGLPVGGGGGKAAPPIVLDMEPPTPEPTPLPPQSPGTPSGELATSPTPLLRRFGAPAAGSSGTTAAAPAKRNSGRNWLPRPLSSKGGARGGTASLSAAASKALAAPPGYFLGWTSPGTQIWSRLRMAGLQVERVYSLDRRQVLLKMKLPRKRLEEAAERLRLRLRLRDGTMARFRIGRRRAFVGAGINGELFRVAESQRIVDYIVRSKIKDGGAELDERTPLGKSITKRLPLHDRPRLEELFSLWVVYWRPAPPPGSRSFPRGLGHAHLPGTYGSWAGSGGGGRPPAGGSGPFARGWRVAAVAKAVLGGCLSQPLELVAEYFGETIAFYFAWMGFYTRWLILPSVVGFVFFCAQMHRRTLDHPAGPLYSLFIMGWATAFLVCWRRRCSELAYRWGVLDYEAEEQVRPQFCGRQRLDDITGQYAPYYPRWRRWLVYCLTGPAVAGFVVGVLVLMLVVFTARDRAVLDATVGVDGTAAAGGGSGAVPPGSYASWGFWLVLLVLPCLYGIAIPILYQGCKRIGTWLTRMENYETESRYRNALILKVFSFRFVTVFASLYYYAFISTSGGADWKMLRLLASLLSFMTVGQWWYMAWMTFVPAFLQKRSVQKLRRSVDEERQRLEAGADAEMARAAAANGGGSSASPVFNGAASPPSAPAAGGVSDAAAAAVAKRAVRRGLLEEAASPLWEEALLKEYDLFDDYTMSLIQFGYVTFFSLAFPLAPLLALFNNLMQTRVDAYKLCRTRRRPVAQKAGGIGVWDNVLELMTVIAVITNCALVGITSTQLRRLLPGLSPQGQLVLVVVAEHVLLFLKYWLEASVARVPRKVRRALLREQVAARNKRKSNAAAGNNGGGGGGNAAAATAAGPKAMYGAGGGDSTAYKDKVAGSGWLPPMVGSDNTAASSGLRHRNVGGGGSSGRVTRPEASVAAQTIIDEDENDEGSDGSRRSGGCGEGGGGVSSDESSDSADSATWRSRALQAAS